MGMDVKRLIDPSFTSVFQSYAMVGWLVAVRFEDEILFDEGGE